MKIKHFWKPVLWLAIICYALFIPAENIPTKPFISFPHFDKIVHFSMFFIFCVLLFRPFKKSGLKYYLLAPLISVLLGAVLESAQRILTTSRSSDFYDFLANTTGIVAALLFYFLFVSGKKWEKLF